MPSNYRRSSKTPKDTELQLLLQSLNKASSNLKTNSKSSRSSRSRSKSRERRKNRRSPSPTTKHYEYHHYPDNDKKRHLKKKKTTFSKYDHRDDATIGRSTKTTSTKSSGGKTVHHHHHHHHHHHYKADNDENDDATHGSHSTTPQCLWSEETPLPDGVLTGHGSCAIDDQHMIILGGDGPDRQPSDAGYIYNIRNQKWVELPNPMPHAMSRCGVVFHKGSKSVYVIGGRQSRKRSSSVYRLSLRSFQWHRMARMSTPRDGCAVAVVGDSIYAFGGKDQDDQKLSSAERYSISRDSWSDLRDMRYARDGHFAAVMDNKIYIMGDFLGFRAVEVYDTSARRWKSAGSVPATPVKLFLAAAVTVEDRFLIVVGGEGRIDRDGASCLIYDKDKNEWLEGDSDNDDQYYDLQMSTSRGLHSAVVLGGDRHPRIVVAGGRDERGHRLKSVESVAAMDLLQHSGAMNDEDIVVDLKCCCWWRR